MDFNNGAFIYTVDNSMTLKGVIAGGIVGTSELLFSYPIDLSKTLLQLDGNNKSLKYNGIFDVLKQTFKSKGIRGLYKGLGIVMIFKAPQESMRFGVYEKLKSLTVDEDGKLDSYMRFFCGFGAGLCEAVFVVTPMETIKVKLIHDQQTKGKYKGLFLRGVAEIVKAEGFRGLYKGLTPTMVKQSTNQAIRFYIVETLKNWYRVGEQTGNIPAPIVGAFGVAAGAASVFINNPVDVVKTRMQGLYAREYKSTLGCVKEMYKNEGAASFYKGMKARLLRVSIDAGYTFMFYEAVVGILTRVI